MARYAALPEHIREALEMIEPTGDEELKYYPCRVTLNNGTILDTVYIEPEIPYLRFWGVYPEDDRHKRFVRIEDVLKVEDSPTRLPARFANEIYDNGESGMGYVLHFGGGITPRKFRIAGYSSTMQYTGLRGRSGHPSPE